MAATRNNKAQVAKHNKSAEKPEEYCGLCSTCNHASECINAKRATEPILFCEMFDDYVKPGQVNKSQTQAGSIPTEKEPGRLKGLCVNCEERHTCKFPKPDGGVWHCEEYR